MFTTRFASACVILALVSIAACDDDPASPKINFQLSACPVAPLGVNAPIQLNFNQRLSPTTLTSSNIVVSDARTGNEIPGTLTVTSTTGPSTVSFVPSSPLPFETPIRIRVQNLLTDSTNVPVTLKVCEVVTELPPIRELFWNRLPSVTGNRVVGASLVGVDSGSVISTPGTVFRRRASDFIATFDQPYYSQGNDVSFADPLLGFASQIDARNFRAVLLRTLNGGANWDTIYSDSRLPFTRLYFKRFGTTIFGVVGGGGATRALFLKYQPATNTFTSQAFGAFSNTNDFDFVPGDTLSGVASTSGAKFGTVFKPGQLFRSVDGGTTWTEIVPALANAIQVSYLGVAIRTTGEIWGVGGGGYVRRLTPSGGTYTVARVPLTAFPGIVNPDSSNFNALIFTDVQFAPDNNLKGWIVGARLVGTVNGVPQFQGFIYETKDGGNTWTRQGVRGANDFGGSFPRLNRLEVLNSNNVWIVGDAGTVLEYKPTAP